MKSSAGPSCPVAGSSWATSGRRSSSVFSAAGKPSSEASISGPSSRRKLRRSGEISSRPSSVGESSRAAGPQLGDQRIGLAGELVQALEGQPRLALERRQRAERGLQLGVPRRGRREHRVGVLDQRAQLGVALGQRAEDDARVGHQARERALLAVEDRDQVGRVLGERPEVAERVVEVAPVVGDRGRLRLHPVLERRAGLRVEGAQDLVELDRVRHLRGGQRAALRDRLGGVAARRQLHVGLAQQRLLAQDRARVRRQRRVARAQLDLDVRAARDLVRRDLLDLADGHAGDPDVGLQRELVGLEEGRVEAVALRLQRHRAAEGQPQEQQQPEARQREQHHRGDLAEAGSVLNHRCLRSRPAPSTAGRSAPSRAR